MMTEGKVAREAVLITGAAQGIGFACARQAAERGARVAIVDMNGSAAEAAVDQLPGSGHAAYGANVADADAVQRVVDEFARISPITGAVAAAGIVNREALVDVSDEQFRRVFEVNVFGTQHTLQAVARAMQKSDTAGSLVVLGSVAAFTGGGLMGSGVYAASKAAVIGLVRGYARELAPLGIRANLVAPGGTRTPMTDALDAPDRERIENLSLLKRLLDPTEIAFTVSFLLGRDSSSITGQVIHASGGVVFG